MSSRLLQLPDEIILLLGRTLESTRDINALAQACKSLYHRLNPVLYRFDRSHGGNSALIWAARRGIPGILQHATDASTVPVEEEIPMLHMAAHFGHPDVVDLLINEYKFSPDGDDGLGYTPLGRCIGNPKSVQMLLRHGANPSKACNPDGILPLHEAAAVNNVPIAEFLIAAGASVTDATSSSYDPDAGFTPLHAAAWFGSLDAAKLFLRHGADVNQAAETSAKTPLHEAVLASHTDVAMFLVENGADASLVATSGDRSWRAVDAAVAEGEVALVKLILDKGLDPNIRQPNGDHLIQTAVEKERLKIVRLLLDNGVQLDGPAAVLPDEEKLALLKLAIEQGSVSIAKLLLSRGGGSVKRKTGAAEVTPLGLACSLGSKPLISQLIKGGADPLAVDENGATILHYAIMSEDTEIVRMILKQGLDIDARDINGQSALFYAMDQDVSLAKLLLDHGADPLLRDNNNNTTLFNAAGGSDVRVFRLLLEAGVDPNQANVAGSTPLHYASSKGNTEHVRLLLDANVDTAGINSEGISPLPAAAAAGNEAIVRMLLEHSPNLLQLETQPTFGNAPLMQAIEGQNAAVVELLLKSGASLEVRNSAGQTPLIVAAKFPSTDVVKTLLAAGKMDLDEADLDGRTALFFACWFGRKETVDLLLEQNPRPKCDVQDRYGATPLIMAARNGHFAVMLVLLGGHYDDLTTKDVFGHDVFYWTAQHSEEDPMVDLVRGFAKAVGAEMPEGPDAEQSMEEFTEIGCLCDICGRCLTSASSGYPQASECKLCNVGDIGSGFICCYDCVDKGQMCRGEDHELEWHDCECEDGAEVGGGGETEEAEGEDEEEGEEEDNKVEEEEDEDGAEDEDDEGEEDEKREEDEGEDDNDEDTDGEGEVVDHENEDMRDV